MQPETDIVGGDSSADRVSRVEREFIRADLGALVRRSAGRHGQSVAVRCGDTSLTYDELVDRASRLANALTARGLEKGDRVALLGRNSLELPEQLVGIAFAGLVRVTCYAHETGEVNGYMMSSTGSRILLVHVDQYATIRPQLAEIGVDHVWVYGGEVPDGAEGYEEVLAAASTDFAPVEIRPEDPHVIRFSAGTTGRPKGILHTAGAWSAIIDEYRWVTPALDERDTYLVAGQLSHAALLWFWQMLAVGGRLVLMPAFDPGEFLRLLEEQRCTVTLVVPTMISALLAHRDTDAYDVTSMRCLNYAGAPISERTLGAAVARFGPVLHQLYASSEALVITMLQPHQHEPGAAERDRRRSAGRPTPFTELRVVDEDGLEIPTGEVGEIAVRNQFVMSAIWGDAAATDARFTPEGFLLTRDMGYVDDDGFVYIADRKEDMIVSGGFNIWPAEVENAVAAHPGVHEVCVVGVPHEKWGETPRAYVVLTPGAVTDEAAVIATTRSLLGPVKKVTSVEFVSELPKSGVGKILRREVRAWSWGTSRIRVSGA